MQSVVRGTYNAAAAILFQRRGFVSLSSVSQSPGRGPSKSGISASRLKKTPKTQTACRIRIAFDSSDAGDANWSRCGAGSFQPTGIAPVVPHRIVSPFTF